MVVYDITKRVSFDHVARWIEELRAHADDSTVIMLVGNKSDLTDKRTVSTEDAVEFAETQRLFFSEMSALSGGNVDEAFFRLLEEIYSRRVVVSRKALESDDGGSAVKFDGSRIDVISGSDLEMKKTNEESSSCSC